MKGAEYAETSPRLEDTVYRRGESEKNLDWLRFIVHGSRHVSKTLVVKKKCRKNRNWSEIEIRSSLMESKFSSEMERKRWSQSSEGFYLVAKVRIGYSTNSAPKNVRYQLS